MASAPRCSAWPGWERPGAGREVNGGKEGTAVLFPAKGGGAHPARSIVKPPAGRWARRQGPVPGAFFIACQNSATGRPRSVIPYGYIHSRSPHSRRRPIDARGPVVPLLAGGAPAFFYCAPKLGGRRPGGDRSAGC
jgi:hypothetical protein